MNPSTPARHAPVPAPPPVDPDEGEGDAPDAPVPAAPTTRRLAVVVSSSTVARLDRAAETLGRRVPGARLSRADAARALLLDALDRLEHGADDEEGGR